MPNDTALAMHKAYITKRKQNPAADKATIFKYILWDRFNNKMVTDAEMLEMARSARSLSELTYAILCKENPAMAEGRLAESAQSAIRSYFNMNFPDGL